jgi:hypothetical protein
MQQTDIEQVQFKYTLAAVSAEWYFRRIDNMRTVDQTGCFKPINGACKITVAFGPGNYILEGEALCISIDIPGKLDRNLFKYSVYMICVYRTGMTNLEKFSLEENSIAKKLNKEDWVLTTFCCSS